MLTAERPQSATKVDPGKIPGLPSVDLERFAAALADLEFYVDGLLEDFAPTKIDPWADTRASPA